MESAWQYLEENNISGWLVIAQFWIALLPRLYFSLLGPGSQKGPDGKSIWDSKAPRDYPSRLSRARAQLGHKLAEKIIRSEAAVNNALENLPLFAIAVLAANLGNDDIWQINSWTIRYIYLRVAYTYLYIFAQDNPRVPGEARSVVWLASIAVLGYMFLLPFREGIFV
ncbi:hypothetical protein GGR53DRAFT_469580 [Hypoxylon sp. FL1150]|nr:hypothetical protein GGR53DRAFT_469580 [Hypoxylon sp. FL1150]